MKTGFWLASAAVAAGCLAQVPQASLPVRLSCPKVPGGAIAQVRISLVTPKTITKGRIVIDFDKTVFGPVASVDVFSAMGDQMGVADIQDRHVDIRFQSQTGGIGRLPGTPVAVVNVHVLPSFVPGRTASITVVPTDTEWRDIEGNQYRATAAPTEMRVGGTLAIGSVTPGGGALPAGAKVRIAGVGFEPASTVQVEGVAIQSTSFTGRDTLEFTLAGPADLTGKRVMVRNRDGTQADFYSALRGKVLNSSGPTVQPIFAQRTYIAASGWPAVQNPNTEPVVVTYTIRSSRGLNQLMDSASITLAPGDVALTGPSFTPTGTYRSSELKAAQAIRMVSLFGLQGADGSSSVYAVSAPSALRPRFTADWTGVRPQCLQNAYLFMATDPACVLWLAGSTVPPALPVTVTANGPPTMFSISIATTGSKRWLSTPRLRASTTDAPRIAFNFDPEGLTPGEYEAGITLTPELGFYSPVTLHLTLRVTTSIISMKGEPMLSFRTDADGRLSDPISLEINSDGEPARFTVRMRNRTFGEWLTFNPSEGTTPATVKVAADPNKATGSDGLDYVLLEGPANSVALLAMLSLEDKRPPPRVYAPPIVTFWAKMGSTTPMTTSVTASGPSSTYTVSTDPETVWLKVQTDPPGAPQLLLTADPTGLAPGVYQTTVLISTPEPSNLPGRVIVRMTVYSDAPLLTTSPARIELSLRSGETKEPGAWPETSLETLSDGVPIGAAFQPSTENGIPWLALARPPIDATFHTVVLGADARNLPPGEYRGAVKVTAPPDTSNTIDVPVTLRVTAALPPLLGDWPPLAATLVNAASQLPGAVAPGEVVTIYGLNVGPGSQVLFDDVPGTVQSASPTQVNAVVPAFVSGRSNVNIAVEASGDRTLLGTVPVAAAAPALFTANGLGVGQVNAFNQDGTRNGPSNAALRNSAVKLFATGLGVALVQPVTLTLGGVAATVMSISPVTEGVTELSVTIPASAPTDASVPVVLQVGDMSSPGGVTIAIR